MTQALIVRRAGALLLALASTAGLAAGCLQTTVKPTQRTVLTSEEAARERERREKGDEDDAAKDIGAPPRPARPTTPEGEIEYYRGLVEQHPTDPQWHFALGRAYERAGKFPLAEIRYREGAKLIPDAHQYTGPHFVLGRVLARQSKETEALASLRKAVAIQPPSEEGYYLNADYRESYFLIGAILFRRDPTASETAFRQFIKYGGERERAIPFFPQLIAAE